VLQKAQLRGADVIAQGLRGLGVTTVFCYPGGANLEILDALSRVEISLIRTEHEQGAVFAAQGYARATGLLGVCLATSGPGATNLVTGIADANSDSIPILALTGNVATRWLGRNAFQEVDIVAITRPVTKLAEQVKDASEIGRALYHAAQVALSGRPGPVLLDFPKDVQQAKTAAPLPQLPAKDSRVPIAEAVLAQIASTLADSKRPVIYAGGGVIASGTGEELARLAERLHCPVVLTIMGLGAVRPDHPLLLGPLGMHGAYCANVAINEADVVLALGVRFDDRVTGDPAAFAGSATIVHIDVDRAEIGKNKPVHIGAHADLRSALQQLSSIAPGLDTAPWLAYLRGIAEERPLRSLPQDARLSGPRAIAMLAGRLPANAVVTTGVGQHQMWAMQHLRPTRSRSFLSSSGFGTMGFGLPAAIGAKQALPGSLVVDIDGDGSLNMTINELSTCRRHGLGVKVFVVNNQWLGMVRQWQDMIYAGNRVTSALGDPVSEVRPASGNSSPYPDFLAIATGYRIKAERVTMLSQLDAAIGRMLSDPDEPYLLDVLVERDDNVYPMIPAGKTYRDVVFDASGGGVSDT
jgi:acetolactate synthase-1/2/3 large subunit